ncbi:AAA family ATPase [Desulfonatronospira sp.]|uniref:AAA family ATPase n=1 Tax=Desulfonatronospira sp. TaxID=1962951 RepID=UPI0025C5A915|nr:AAA family ATPase [Desulfonatronospira sp.]
MNIKKMHLSNFRGAQALDLDFQERLNIFVGVNGSGKSTVLDAAALLLSWLANRIKSTGSSGRPITESDILNGTSVSTLEITCKINKQDVRWKMVKVRKGHTRIKTRSYFSELNELTEEIKEQITVEKEKTNLPVLAYYPVNRAVLDIPLRIKSRHRFNLLAAYDDSLTGAANFRTFFEWFREREDLENEARVHSAELETLYDQQLSYPDVQLESVRKALNMFMPEFTDLTVRRSPLRMEVKKDGYTLIVDQLSDGEKCLMAMVGDLARRMAIANPDMENPLEGQGVVLIDEIDLHLHPKWQRLIVPRLLEAFPNCQFVISTHSPHVLTHVKPDNIFLLSLDKEGISAKKPTESYGKNVDRILEDIMGLETTRPSQVTSDINQLYKDINANRIDLAREKIARLHSEIGNDPELIKASVLIKRKELIGK